MREKCLHYCFVLLLILLVEVDLSSSLKNKHRPCKQVGTCRCVFPSGSEVNLLGLKPSGWVSLSQNVSVYFSPCVDVEIVVDEGPNGCSGGASICLRVNNTDTNKTNGTVPHNVTYTLLGKAADGKFSNKIDEPLKIEFANSLTTVLLTCSENQNSSLLKPREENNHYILELLSSRSCLGVDLDVDESGLSTGSVLVLMFFVLMLVYFGGGMLTLRLLRGAEGKEMIPNYEFWADLPYLVRDGIIFTLSGFQSSPSYDRI